MMTQSVMTQAARLFGNASGSVTSKGKQTGSGFDLMFDSNLRTSQNVNENKALQTKDTKTSDVTNSNAERTDKAQPANTKAKEVTAADSGKETGTDKVKDLKQTEKALEMQSVSEKPEASDESELTVNEQLIAEITGLMQAIKEVVMNMLKLTPEELENLMAQQELGLSDLLQPENLQKLVLASSGAKDILAVLTDENLETTMKDLLAQVDNLMKEAELPFTMEQIKSILDQVEEQAKKQSQLQQQAAQNFAEATPNTKTSHDTVSDKVAITTQAVPRDDQKQTNTLHNDKENAKDSIANPVQQPETETEAGANQESNKDNDLMSMEDPFRMFVDNLTKVSTQTQVDFSGSLVQVTELRDIANQIIERIKVSVSMDQTSMELQLNPEHLGKVNLTVQSKNGMMTAQFVVQNEISKEAIESQLHTLKETLTNQGIKVDAIEVTVASYTFEQNTGEGFDNQAEAQKKSSGRQISLEEAMNMTDIPEEGSTMDLTGIRGSQIDYTA